MNIKPTVALATFVLGGVALAQPKPAAKAEAPVKAEPKAPPTQVLPAELVEHGKTLTGTWKCTGEMNTGPGGMVKVTATNKVKVELDKWWIAESLEVKGFPMPLKMQTYTTFDATSKKWRRVTFDNWGRQLVGTADAAPMGQGMTFNLDVIGGQGSGQFRDHLEAIDPKAGQKLWGELSTDKGKSWNKAYEMTCKK
jgi:hypothetical protein